MGKELAETFPEAKALFEKADALLGVPLSRASWEGPQELLTSTEYCQPALYVASLAALAALHEELELTPEAAAGAGGSAATRWSAAAGAGGSAATRWSAAAGLSLGEYTALAAAGAFSFEEGLKLVGLRGQAMEEASRMNAGTMASVMGLDLPVLEAICAETGAQVANINAPGQIVISGTVPAVEAASEKARERGAKRVALLEVGGAFHSRLMEPAGERLQVAVEAAQIRETAFPVLSNVTASFHEGPAQIRALLVRQLIHPVRWEACMRALLQSGIRLFLEVGPGTVLKGLMRRIDPEAQVLSVGNAAQVREAAAALRSA
ncbi:MAG: ACP S-malonyltransferase [Candidatus Omnitrophica bacterium]|nr:ACP S-malonyltransferase [Candidatus Omnitrophota bacterium]